MNLVIETLCKIIDFSNLFLVITDKDGIINSISDRVSQHIVNRTDEYVGVTGKCWYDFINEEYKEKVIQVYKEVSEDTSICRELQYPIGLNEITTVVKWIISYVNHEYNLILSIGIPVAIDESEKEFDSIRKQYFDLVNKDRKAIEELKESVSKRAELISKDKISIDQLRDSNIGGAKSTC